jgi:beta-alanine--pyruvate transaminase
MFQAVSKSSAAPDSTSTTIAVTADLPTMDHQWLPFTPNREFIADPQMFGSARDAWFYDLKGRTILDAGSGLFTTPAGHCRKEIADAVYAQLQELDFTPSFLRAHPKSFTLANRLAELLPEGIDKLFFVNSGSEAVDTAMKICLAYHRARKEGARNMFVSRERAYHGVNFGGVALSGMVNNRRNFAGVVTGAVHMRHTWLPENANVMGQGKHGGRELADDLLRLIQLHGAENIAACVVEPVAGSTGVLVPPVGYLERLRELCTAHGILLVFDEVICGFGRTGEAFAAQTFDVKPDIITMAKAITNGAVPMAAVAVSRQVHDTIVNAAPDGAIEFSHGYTWSSHPVACAAALATLDIYRDEDLFAKGRAISPVLLDGLATLRELPMVQEVRGMGMIAGVELKSDGAPGRRGQLLQKRLFDAGLHLKSTGDTAIVSPPFIFTPEQVAQTVQILKKTIQELPQ